ncbi:hypothetical protein [Cellvibrio sp. OA-2007]|uniref:hypothetical protein n=1 Tax=Cellvibrio sp. OA-2007 TaxID=529823 RepID=UPI0007867EE9|nr:hypothetical protein [Cellvibrio sp. OA-2007]
MDLIRKDIELIREVRCLCLKHDFEIAVSKARTVTDPETRETLLFICRSFKAAQINVQAA